MSAAIRSSAVLWARLVRVFAIVLFVTGAGLQAGCNGTVEIECDDETPCAFGSSCVAGQCVEGRCATSAQCPIEHYCDARECTPGCEADDDCLPGYRCTAGDDDVAADHGTCVEEACADTKTDCGFREFCNPATGDCYDAGDQYCKFCNDSDECGEGNLCWNHYCGVDCSNGRECPNGFECLAVVDQFGNPQGYQCLTYCWLYEDYEPGAFTATPPKTLGELEAERAAAEAR